MCVCEIGRCAAFFLLSFSEGEEENSKGGGGAGGVLLISSADDAQSVFLEIRKSLLFFRLTCGKMEHTATTSISPASKYFSFFVEAAIASRQNERMGGGTLSKQYAYKNPFC